MSTVALLVIRGYGTQYLGVQRGHTVPGRGPGPADWRSLESGAVKYGRESREN
jgi:hypothetical protein